MSLCVLLYFPPIPSINNIGERERERDREIEEKGVCFGTRQDVSVFAALSCEYSALKYSLPL